MEKNIVEVVMNNKGEVVEKVADYIGVFSFAKTIEALYRECLEDCDNPEDIEEYIADLYGKNIQSLARDFALESNRDMKKYLHMNNHSMPGNFADIEDDYDWEEVDSCWGYYCDEGELIKEVIEEHQLQPSVAA